MTKMPRARPRPLPAPFGVEPMQSSARAAPPRWELTLETVPRVATLSGVPTGAMSELLEPSDLAGLKTEHGALYVGLENRFREMVVEPSVSRAAPVFGL